ncbi:MAG: adenosylcobinamide-phosphate synthase CbiB [Breznakibacter sp.]
MNEFLQLHPQWVVVLSIAAAYFADLLLGDPVWMPHPVVAFGKTIFFFEKKLNHGSWRLTKGMVMALLLIAGTYAFFLMLERFCLYLGDVIHLVYMGLFLFLALANRTLIREGKMVFDRLQCEGLDAGRRQLSRIVGRDTSQLSPQQIRTAVLETMAENLSDGVVAPLFWFAVGGIPAAMAYKMVNTLDSMVGYKNDRHLLFGRVAARIDDLANFIPARITALLMVSVSLSWRGLVFALKYGHRHSSPNAGYPEATLAGILNVRFGGPNMYHGTLVDKPFIGHHDREVVYRDLQIATYVNHAVCLLAVIGAILITIYSSSVEF